MAFTEQDLASARLYAQKVVRDAALHDLQHARVELQRAQNAFDKADEDYQRLVYLMLRGEQ